MSDPSYLPPGSPAPQPPRFAIYAPFTLGFTAALGVGIAYLIYSALKVGHSSFVLLALALFLAAGLDPAVRRIERLGLKRGPAVGIVFLLVIGAIVGLGFAVIPPLASQTTTFAQNLPGYITDLRSNHEIASLDKRFGFLNSIQNYVNEASDPSSVASSVLSIGTKVADSIFSLFSLAILTLYFMAYLRDITAFLYRLSPASRRERVSDIGDRIVGQIGLYVAGTAVLGLVAGLATLLFLWILGVPDPLALAFIVAVLSLIPVLGSALAVVTVCTIAFLTSVPDGIWTASFFVVYLIVQRLVLTPRLLHPSVRISPAAALVGALAGYTTLGLIGFLVSIPTVAVLTLLLREIVLPRQATH